MDEAQILVLDTLRRLLSDWQADRGHAPHPDETAQFWPMIGETGLLGALAPESAGGLGADPALAFEVLHTWGIFAAPGPALASLIGAATILPGSPREDLLDGVADGSVRIAMPSFIETAGEFPQTAGDVPPGAAALPLLPFLRDAGAATHALLPARMHDEPAVLCVDIARLPLSAPFRLVDGATAAEFSAQHIAVEDGDVLMQGSEARTAWLDLMERMTAGAASEAAGLLQAMLDQTVAYVRQRSQFGRAIGSFQAIQHRLAEMLVDVEQSRSLAHGALSAALEGRPDAAMLVSAAKARINRSLQHLSDQAVQLHGGIGTTQELALNRYFRRAMALGREFGTSLPHLGRVKAGIADRIRTLGAVA